MLLRLLLLLILCFLLPVLLLLLLMLTVAMAMAHNVQVATMWLWIFGGQQIKQRRQQLPGQQPSRPRIPASVLYPTQVQQAIRTLGLVDPVASTQKAFDWGALFNASDRCVIGLAQVVLAPRFDDDPLRDSLAHEQALQLYWSSVHGHGTHVTFLRVISAFRLLHPQAARPEAEVSQGVPRTLFFRLTEMSCEALANAPSTTTNEAGHPRIMRDLLDGAVLPRACIRVPCVHAELLTRGVWPTYCVPCIEGSHARLGIQFVPDLALPAGLPIDAPGNAVLDADSLDKATTSLIQVAQAVMTGTAADDPQTLDRLRGVVSWLTNLRSQLAGDDAAHRRVHDMQHLIHCVASAGLLQDAGDLRTAVLLTLRGCLPPALSKVCEEILTQPTRIPSRSQLYAHRSTLHLGWILLQRTSARKVLEEDGGRCVRWSTVDASPQGSHDWLMSASVTMSVADSARALRMAEALVSCPANAAFDAQEKQLIDTLAPLLQWHPACPVAQGSGRASLEHKLHALIHKERLQSCSWSDAASLLNSTVSWTTDQGVESGIAALPPMDLMALFPWPVHNTDIEPDSESAELCERAAAGLAPATVPSLDFRFETGEPGDPGELGDPEPGQPVFATEAAATEEKAEAAATTRANPRLAAPAAAAAATAAAAPGTAASSRAGPAESAPQLHQPPPLPPPPPPHDPLAGLALFVDMSRSLPVCGVLHVVHNATNGLWAALSHFTTFSDELKSVCDLLRRRWSKDRLLQTCFCSPEAAEHTDAIQSFSGQVYSKRWGTLAHAVEALLPLERALRCFWDARTFNFGQPVGPDEEQPADAADAAAARHAGRVRVMAADRAIRNPLFWAYLRVIQNVTTALKKICYWAEHCPCARHQSQPDGVEVGPLPPELPGLYQRTGHKRCPLNGLRAPEMATGEFLRVFGRFAAQSNSDLVTRVVGLPQHEKDLVLQDFAAARRFLSCTFQIKLSCWQQSPLTLCALAHQDPAEARRGVARALALYDTNVAQQHTQHALAHEACSPGLLRDELLAFCVGAELHTLPAANALAARLRFIPIVERFVESIHAKVHKHLKFTHHGPIHVSWQLTKRTILESILTGGPDFLSQFAAACTQVRNPWRSVQELGFVQHPLVQHLLAIHGGSKQRAFLRQCRSSLLQVLYHVDATTLYQSLPKVAIPTAAIADNANAVDAAAAPGPAAGCRFLQVWHDAATEFLLDCMAVAKTGAVFSISTLAAPAGALRELADVVNPPPAAVSEDAALEPAAAACEFDILSSDMDLERQLLGLVPGQQQQEQDQQQQQQHQQHQQQQQQQHQPQLQELWELQQEPQRQQEPQEAQEPAPQQQQQRQQQPVSPLYFFTSVAARPANLHVSKFAPRIGALSMCISPLSIMSMDASGRHATLALEHATGRAASVHLLSLQAFSADELRAVHAWNSGPLRYEFCGLPTGPADSAAVASDLLSEMFDAGALPDEAAFTTDVAAPGSMLRAILEHWVAHGCCEHVRALGTPPGVAMHGDAAYTTSWRLTLHGVERVALVHNACDPVPLLRVRDHIQLKDATVFELLSILMDKGFECRVSALGDRRPPAFESGAAPLWWLHHKKQPPRLYLVALLSAHAGQLEAAVEHFKPAGWYAALIDGVPYVPHRRKRQPPLHFLPVGDEPVEEPPPEHAAAAAAKQRKPRPCKRKHKKASSNESHRSSSDSDNSCSVTSAASALKAKEAKVHDGNPPLPPPPLPPSPSDGPPLDPDPSRPSPPGPASPPRPVAPASSSSDSDSDSSSSSQLQLSACAALSDLGSLSDVSDASLFEATDAPESHGGPTPPTPGAKAGAPKRQAATAAMRGSGSSTTLRPTTRFFFSCRCTEIFVDGVHRGWEIQCYHAGHREPGGRGCVRSRRFPANASFGQQDDTLRKLAWWAKAGDGQPSAEFHRQLPEMPLAGLPSWEELHTPASGSGGSSGDGAVAAAAPLAPVGANKGAPPTKAAAQPRPPSVNKRRRT